jgi:endonuclease YncB( thermonuclease family)
VHAKPRELNLKSYILEIDYTLTFSKTNKYHFNSKVMVREIVSMATVAAAIIIMMTLEAAGEVSAAAAANWLTQISNTSEPLGLHNSITTPTQPYPPNANCDASYPNVCIASPPPDLNCDDIVDENFKVIPPDPHGFDSEGDGTGCEAGSASISSSSNEVVPRESISKGNVVSNIPGSRSGLPECKGSADCFKGVVTDIVDGDTFDVNNVRIRLSMVNTPERGEVGYNEATDFTESTCQIGGNALVDEDDGQKEGSYDRLIGVVYCNDSKASVNQLLLEAGKATVYEDFCDVSEFANDKWVTNFGC